MTTIVLGLMSNKPKIVFIIKTSNNLRNQIATHVTFPFESRSSSKILQFKFKTFYLEVSAIKNFCLLLSRIRNNLDYFVVALQRELFNIQLCKNEDCEQQKLSSCSKWRQLEFYFNDLTVVNKNRVSQSNFPTHSDSEMNSHNSFSSSTFQLSISSQSL